MVIELTMTLRALVEVDEREWDKTTDTDPESVRKYFVSRLTDQANAIDAGYFIMDAGGEVSEVSAAVADPTPFVGELAPQVNA